MKEKIIEAVGNRLDKLEVWIDDVRLTREGTEETLEIVLDSKDMIDLQKVVMATRIINPILDKIDLIMKIFPARTSCPRSMPQNQRSTRPVRLYWKAISNTVSVTALNTGMQTQRLKNSPKQ